MGDRRKRYYIVGPDLVRNPSDLEWLNLDEALPGPDRRGRHAVRVSGYAHPMRVGLPMLAAKPKLKVALRNTPLDIYGFDQLFISSRAKDLLERVDPEAFEFAECETTSRRSIAIEPYWFVRIVRVVDRFDEARSQFRTYAEMNLDAPDAATNYNIVRLDDIHMPEGFPDGFHAFFFGRFRRYPIFDEVIVDAWRKGGLTGALFTPLQPPLKPELKRIASFFNYPFWGKGTLSRVD